MVSNILTNSLVAALNRANLNELTQMLTLIKFGDFVRSMPTQLRGKSVLAAAANPYVDPAAGSLYLPDDAKAAFIFAAYARAGTGTPAALVVDAPAAGNPAAGHCAVSPSGDIVFRGADAWTSVDVLYLPQKQDIQELVLPVVSNTLTLPTTFGGKPAVNVSLLEVEALVGTHTGKFSVIAPGGSVTTLLSAMNTAKTTVQFASADAVTSARVKYGVAKLTDLDALLEAASNFI